MYSESRNEKKMIFFKKIKKLVLVCEKLDVTIVEVLVAILAEMSEKEKDLGAWRWQFKHHSNTEADIRKPRKPRTKQSPALPWRQSQLHSWTTQCVTLYKTLFGFLCKVDLRFTAGIIIKRVFRNARSGRTSESHTGSGQCFTVPGWPHVSFPAPHVLF